MIDPSSMMYGLGGFSGMGGGYGGGYGGYNPYSMFGMGGGYGGYNPYSMFGMGGGMGGYNPYSMFGYGGNFGGGMGMGGNDFFSQFQTSMQDLFSQYFGNQDAETTDETADPDTSTDSESSSSESSDSESSDAGAEDEVPEDPADDPEAAPEDPFAAYGDDFGKRYTNKGSLGKKGKKTLNKLGYSNMREFLRDDANEGWREYATKKYDSGNYNEIDKPSSKARNA